MPRLDDRGGTKMKGYKETEQAFGVGDLATLHDPEHVWRVKIVSCAQDEDGSWWYEVTPIGFSELPREVPQRKLEAIA